VVSVRYNSFIFLTSTKTSAMMINVHEGHLVAYGRMPPRCKIRGRAGDQMLRECTRHPLMTQCLDKLTAWDGFHVC